MQNRLHFSLAYSFNFPFSIDFSNNHFAKEIKLGILTEPKTGLIRNDIKKRQYMLKKQKCFMNGLMY